MKKLLSTFLMFTTFWLVTALKIDRQYLTTVHKPTVYLLASTRSFDNRNQLQETIVYSYDTKNHLTGIKYIGNDTAKTGTFEDKLGYDNDDRLINQIRILNNVPHFENGIFRTTNYRYLTGHIIKHIVEKGTNRYGPYVRVLIDTLLLNDKQQVVKHLRSFGDSLHRSNFYDVLTYDKQGRLATLTAYQPTDQTKPNYAFAYAYYNSKNPFLNVKGNYMVSFDTPEYGNLKTSHSEFYNHTLNKTTVINNQAFYQLNADGYPVTKTFIVADSNRGSNTGCLKYSYITK